jgi:hypothetical protein
MDPSGDFFIVEAHDRNAKFLHGTGKWKGITGGFAANPFTRGKPIIPDTLQGCAKLIPEKSTKMTFPLTEDVWDPL